MDGQIVYPVMVSAYPGESPCTLAHRNIVRQAVKTLEARRKVKAKICNVAYDTDCDTGKPVKWAAVFLFDLTDA